MDQHGINERFNEKLDLLRRIKANSESQLRLVRNDKQKGLKRLLDEGDMLIDRLCTINREIMVERGKDELESKPTIRWIEEIQDEILNSNRLVIRAAELEREKTAHDLRCVRTMKKLHKSYTRAEKPYAGRMVNKKG